MLKEIVALLAVFRITYFAVYEDGPYDFMERTRNYFKNAEWINATCFNCMSVWVSLPFALGFNYWFMHWLAFSGAAMILNNIYGWFD